MKVNKWAAAPALLYLLAVTVLFVAHLYSVRFNAGDSGESAIPLYLLALPWIMLVPQSLVGTAVWPWLTYPLLGFCVALNALLGYAATIGLLALGRWTIRWVRLGVKR